MNTKIKKQVMIVGLLACSYLASAQSAITRITLKKEAQNKYLGLNLCKSPFVQVRAEYQIFTDHVTQAPSNASIYAVDFTIKLYEVLSSDGVSLTSAPIVAGGFLYTGDCKSLGENGVGFSTYNNTYSISYNVSLDPIFGKLRIKNVSNNTQREFSLTHLGNSVYRGTRATTNGEIEVVVIVLAKAELFLGG